MGPLFPAEREAPVETYLNVLRNNGVDKAVIVPLSAHHKYVGECLRRYPDMFAGIGVLDVETQSPKADFVKLMDAGFQGARVHRLGSPDAITVRDLETLELLETMKEGGYKVWYYAGAGQLPLLELALEDLPGLHVVLNHLGFPMPERFVPDRYGRPKIATEIPPPTFDRIKGLARFPNVYVMFSGHYAFSKLQFPYRDLQPVNEGLLNSYGPARVLWGSDYPWVAEIPGYRGISSLVDKAFPGLSSQERSLIMGGNAARLFTFTA